MVKFALKLPLLLSALALVSHAVSADTTPQSAQAVIQSQLQAEFNAAKALYDARRYDQSYQAFNVLWRKQPSSLAVNFYLGRSALELKRYNQAMAAFDRVLMLNPNHIRTRLEMARLYFETDDIEMALNELDLALSAPMPDEVRANVLAFKQRIESQESRHSHAFTFVAGLNYDSNARNDIGASNSFQLPGFANIELSGNEEVEDFGLGATLVYNHVYDLGEREGWVLENQLVAFNRKNKELSENDVLYFAGSVAPSLQESFYKISLPIEFDQVFLDGKRYLNNLSAGINLQQVLSPSQLWNVGYKLRNMTHADENRARDAWAHVYNFGYRHTHGEVNPITFSAQINFETRNQQASNQTSDPASLAEQRVRFEVSKPINARWRASGAITLRETNYDQYNALFLNKRSDKVYRLDLGAMYQLDRKSMLTGGVGYADHQSNQAPFEFNKFTANFNYVLRF